MRFTAMFACAVFIALLQVHNMSLGMFVHLLNDRSQSYVQGGSRYAGMIIQTYHYPDVWQIGCSMLRGHVSNHISCVMAASKQG